MQSVRFIIWVLVSAENHIEEDYKKHRTILLTEFNIISDFLFSPPLITWFVDLFGKLIG